MPTPFVFHRPELANRLADAVLGQDILGDRSGLFLAAPRRTGKSTFLTVDLLPELARRGVMPVYVDLWADRNADPGETIRDALLAEAKRREPALVKAARKAGVSKLKLGPVAADFAGSDGRSPLVEIIRTLTEAEDIPLVLVVDEAQHAVTTPSGANALFALKSARDTLNSTAAPSWRGNVRLGLIFTGSNRDKLTSLVTDRKQAFFGASVHEFPLLDRGYVEAYVDYLNEGLARDRAIDVEEAQRAFLIVQSRPEVLQRAVRRLVTGSVGPAQVPATLVGIAEDERDKYWADLDSQWDAMTSTQRAVVGRMVQMGSAFRAFDAQSLADYAIRAGHDVTAAEAQSALEALRDQGLVLKSSRGLYVFDDGSVLEWFASRGHGANDADDDEDEHDGKDGIADGP